MLTKLLQRIRPTEAERVAKVKARLIDKYPGDRDSIWRVESARGSRLVILAGLYKDVLSWAFTEPDFFENGKAGDVVQLLPTFKSDSTLRGAESSLTRLASSLPQLG